MIKEGKEGNKLTTLIIKKNKGTKRRVLCNV